jgi:cellulose synthase (UDP-forming)
VRSAWDAVVCAGTSFLVRRAALEDVGGFVEPAISEDLVTGMVLASRGWRLRYLGEKLSAGLAAETMLDFVHQRQRWASGTLQALRLRQGPLRLRGLRWGQRLAYLEGALHWFNTVPRLLLLLMPLCIGLLGITPIQLTSAAVFSLLAPLWIALLLSTGWLNRGSRHALLADLPGWALAIPLAATVLASLWGRVQPFRITPKHREHGRGGIAPVLAAPLLVLLGLNGLNLVWILRQLTAGAGSSAGDWLGLVWGGLTLLGLVVALRACQDPPAGDPTPWLALNLPATLQARDAQGLPQRCSVRVHALSERGAVLVNPPPLGEGWTLDQLQLNGPGGPALPLLPLESAPAMASSHTLRWATSQGALPAREAFIAWLYSRPQGWPERQAPPEWRALGALLARLIRPAWGHQPERLSLVPQQLGPVPGTPAAGNRSGRSPVSAS